MSGQLGVSRRENTVSSNPGIRIRNCSQTEGRTCSGSIVTFFYPSTEWDMEQPFECRCGAKVRTEWFYSEFQIARADVDNPSPV